MVVKQGFSVFWWW